MFTDELEALSLSISALDKEANNNEDMDTMRELLDELKMSYIQLSLKLKSANLA